MHAPPPYQITLRRFGVWRVGCAVLVAASGLATGAWALTAAKVHPVALWVSLAVWAVASIAVRVQMSRLAPVSLRWDGQAWHVGPVTTVGEEPQAGTVSVSIDLGAWMLLRFVPAGARRGVWLPAQRRGHEAAWHGLRATVYCARPVALPIAAHF
ncbi:MAG TPA: hypothetical protein VGD46_06575 [Rhizobacter sp.]